MVMRRLAVASVYTNCETAIAGKRGTSSRRPSRGFGVGRVAFAQT